MMVMSALRPTTSSTMVSSAPTTSAARTASSGGRMPTMEMVNERFARHFRVSLFNLLRRSPEISVGNVQLIKFSEYINSLFVPANMNMVKVRPLRGTALFTLDPKLIFGIVDNFFGGTGRFHAKIEGRDFTPTEMRIIQLVLAGVFDDLKRAWKPMLPLEFSHTGSEVNPHLANIVSPSEVVVVTVFHAELEGGGGELHIAMPYAMIEPIRELLDAGVQSDVSDDDDRWNRSMREEIEAVEITLQTTLTETTLSLRDVLVFEEGSIVLIDMPDEIVATVEDVPVLRGRFGNSHGSLALKVTQNIRHASQALAVLKLE